MGLFIYFLEGHLNHHHHAAHPSSLSLHSHSGFFREINLCLTVTRENYFFSVCCLRSPVSSNNGDKKQRGKEKGQEKSLLVLLEVGGMAEPPSCGRWWMNMRELLGIHQKQVEPTAGSRVCS